ncbi:hypothetical protein [Yellowstone lake phycodnavirus 3]|uniref:virion structural protein n=1 Tax=Yellowstone lake phycodnavirus 3 TaxID=1586715 RepID=UPI0006EB7FA0|nr:virion structural protein [Yellowstone lake phycodnavirus 3]BAT22668.1 hypothetical protein [Yellowstone lake phycodnavirus 3]
MTYIPAVTANVSSTNSTSAALGPGGVFTGTPEDVTQYASASIAFYVTPVTATGNIFVQFSNTNSVSNWVAVSNTVTAVNATTAAGFTLDVTLAAQYYRIIYVNDSAAQTSFMVQTIFHPQARVAVSTTRFAQTPTDYTDMLNTRAVIWGKTTGGNVYEPVATNGENSLVVNIADPRTAFGELSVAANTPISQTDFVYGINTVITSNVVVGSNATVGVSNGLLSVTANAATGASMAMFRPKKFIKYRPGESSVTRITGLFTAGAPANSLQFVGTGFLEPSSNVMLDGMGFGYQGSSFGIIWTRNSSIQFIPQSSWNLDTMQGTGKSGFTLDPTKINIFQLKFQYLGGGNLFFYVMPSTSGRWVLVHMVQNAGTLTTPVFRDPTMHAMWYSNCYAVGNNTPVIVQGASLGQFLEGERRFLGPKGAYAYAPSANVINNVNTMMFALRNATYFNGLANRSQAHIRSVSFGGNGTGTGSNQPNGVIVLTLIRNPTVGGPTIFTPYNGTLGTNFGGVTGSNIFGQSSMSSNISQLSTISGGNVGFTQIVSIGGQSGNIDLTDYEIVLNPGDTLCFTANVVTASATCYIGSSVFWVEDI